MANLPDINTADVGIIAFWNAEDHKTAGVVDPTDCTGVFTNYSVYDNGLDGNISLGSGRLFNCRVKNDGWCVAWIDRTNTFWYPTKPPADFGESGHKGYYDILWNWFDCSSNPSSTLTTLSYIISLLEAALETSGNFTFLATDVGHYCYEFVNANVLTLTGIRGIDYFVPPTGYLQYTSGTTLYHISCTGTAYSNACNPRVTTIGNILSQPLLVDNHIRHGTADIIAKNWMPDPLTDYSLYCQGTGSGSALGLILLIWS